MALSVTSPSGRRLPGFRFDAQAAVPADILPRMDIAVLVGLAGTGPLDLPVPVESPAQFEMIFGRDLPLAVAADGSLLRAHLAPAVRDFFRQGGRRCWIIRVAGPAVLTRFPLPGVMRLREGQLEPAFAEARSPGSGFDSIQVATALTPRSLEVVEGLVPGQSGAVLGLGLQQELRAGDTVRFTFHAEGLEALGSLIQVDPHRPSPPIPTRREQFRVTFGPVHWFAWPATQVPATSEATVTVSIPGSVPGEWRTSVWTGTVPASPAEGLEWPTRPEDREVTLALNVSADELPPLGSRLRVAFGPEILFLRVDSVAGTSESGSPLSTAVRITGEARWWLATPPTPTTRATAELLTFELRTRSGEAAGLRLSGLAFGSTHPSVWNALPSDAALYAEPELSEAIRAADAHDVETLWRTAADPRFPLAGADPAGTTYLPLLMRNLPDQWMGAVAPEQEALVRDGLETFGAALFLDPDLIEASTSHLLEEANFIRFQSDRARRLRGLHAALGLEEATLIAVPDAVHPGWSRSGLPDEPPGVPRGTDEPAWGDFLRCDLRVLSAPLLRLANEPDPAGTFRLEWTHTDPAAMGIEIEEATQAGLGDAVRVYHGDAEGLTLFGRSAGTYYYVARSISGSNTGAWSEPVVVPLVSASRWRVSEWTEAQADQLLAVQRALLRVCAARGDLFAVLALPGAWRTEEALDHLAGLRATNGALVEVGQSVSLPLGNGESAVFSYAAMYHPWLVRPDPTGGLRRVPPDGALTGIIAARSLRRGAWIAPANESLAETVALEPPLPPEDWQILQDAQLNFLRQDAWGFRCLAADTLSADSDLRAINVRRLLQLLRRVALRQGATYVFEPMNDAFVRAVQHGFETLMLQLFARGAFAGRSPAASFQVNTGPTVNPPPSRELGRFIVEIKVAPALPMRFLTLRLVQTGDGAEVTETR